MNRDVVPVTVVTGGPEALVVSHRMRDVWGAHRVSVLAHVSHDSVEADTSWLRLLPVEGYRTSGCECCRVRLDLVEGLRLLVERRARPDHVIVVLDPLCDLSTALQTLLSDPDLQRLIALDAVIATTDAVALSTRLALGLPFGTQSELERLSVADRILVVRGGELVDASLHRAMVSLRTVAGFGLIAVPSVWPVDLHHLAGLNAWHGAPALDPPAAAEPITVEDGFDLPQTVLCAIDGDLDPAAVEEWLDEIVAVNASRILRLQGALSVAGQEFRVCLHGVRSYASSHSEQMHGAEERSTRSVVAISGYCLDADVIRSGFDATSLR